MNDVILISMETWGRVWRRNQNLAVGLAQRFPSRKILFVTLPVDLSNSVRRGHWRTLAGLAMRGLRPEPPQALYGIPNVFVFTPVKLFPHTLTLGRWANQARTRAQIRSAVARLGMVDPLLYINPYYAAHMAGRMGESALVYDVGEDWSQIESRAWLRKQMTDEDDLLTRRADAVIVVSSNLERLKRGAARELHVIPNGVHVDRYTEIGTRTLPPHPMTRDWPHPVLGHTGTLQSRRTDVGLIVELARAFPQGTIALVGPDSLEAECSRRLHAEPNIRMTGEVDFADIPQVMSAFDVCIVPQQVNAFTESQNPLKMFEYLAAGLPIVSTPINGFRDHPELVHLADGPEAFIAAIGAALTESRELVEARQRAAASHTWDARLDAIVAVCESCLEQRRAAHAEPAHLVEEPAHAC